jgi:hypothetical protein
MPGSITFKWMARKSSALPHASWLQATLKSLDCAGLTLDQVQWIVPHQANIRIIEAAARGLKLPMDRFIVNLERYGNTSTASIPIAMVEAVEKGQIKPGDKIVIVGFGAGTDLGRARRGVDGSHPEQGHARPEQYYWFARVRSFVRRAIRLSRASLPPRTIMEN